MRYLFAVGFVSILGQVVLLRELNVAFYGIELIYTLALGIWLLSSACGTMISRRFRSASPVRTNLCFLILSLGIPLDLSFLRSVRLLFSGVPGAYLPLHIQIAAMSISLLPIGLLLGVLFQWAAKAYVANKKSLAAAYAIESLGGVAGGICATLLLKFGFQNFVISLLCALFALGFPFLAARERGAQWLRTISTVVFAALILLLWKAPAIDYLMTSWTHPNLVATRDSPYSRITVALLNGQVSVFENDSLLFDTEGTRAEEFVHLAALQHPNPERILILGGGIEGIVLETLQHSPRTIDYVELNPVLLDTVRRHLPPEIQQSLQAQSVHIIVEDPRQFLNRAPNYDLILVGMPEPASGQTNRFYTREFFRQCYEKLNGQGVLAFRIPSSENVWTPQLARRMISIYRAARSIFPDVLFIPGDTNIVIGSTARLTRDASLLASRLQARRVKTRLVSPNYLHYLYTNDRFMEIARILQSGIAPINTDVRPVCYQYTIAIWLSKFLPSLKLWDFSLPESWSGRGLVWLAPLSLPAMLLIRAPWRVRRAFLTGAAAFVGMVLETTLLLYYQTKSGVLYQDIGILLTGFMAGLALGAIAVASLNRPITKSLGIAMVSGFFLLSIAIYLAINSSWSAGLAATLGLLTLAGFFVAGVFAYASLQSAADQSEVIIPLYSADLIGGCLGSILTSLILAPVAGLAITVGLMVLVLLLSALLL